MRPRVIPTLLVEDGELVKTIQFKNSIYLGDPINTVRLLNDMEVDELVVLDISASKQDKGPNFSLVEDIRNEAFMPLAYGGGIHTVSQVQDLISMGVEKVSLNKTLLDNPNIVKEASQLIGSQSIIGSIDIKKSLFGKYKIFSHTDKKYLQSDLAGYLETLETLGVGELLINLVDRDGTWKGYDLNFVEDIARYVNVPLVICGGASSLDDLKLVTLSGADAAAAGSLFSFQGKDQGVLTNYPSSGELDKLFIDED